MVSDLLRPCSDGKSMVSVLIGFCTGWFCMVGFSIVEVRCSSMGSNASPFWMLLGCLVFVIVLVCVPRSALLGYFINMKLWRFGISRVSSSLSRLDKVPFSDLNFVSTSSIRFGDAFRWVFGGSANSVSFLYPMVIFDKGMGGGYLVSSVWVSRLWYKVLSSVHGGIKYFIEIVFSKVFWFS